MPAIGAPQARPRGQGPPHAARRPHPTPSGRLDASGAQEGQTPGQGHTAWAAARVPGPALRVVCAPRARRGGHGDLPGQGAGHLPCGVSRPVSCRHVAVGGAVGPTVAPRLGRSTLRSRFLHALEGYHRRLVALSVCSYACHPGILGGQEGSTPSIAAGGLQGPTGAPLPASRPFLLCEHPPYRRAPQAHVPRHRCLTLRPCCASVRICAVSFAVARGRPWAFPRSLNLSEFVDG
jgi:hypothetical protein